MDTRTGNIYPSEHKALQAGVLHESLAAVVGYKNGTPVIQFKTGPFKDRLYTRTPDGQLRRVHQVKA